MDVAVLGWALNLGFAGSGTVDVIPTTIADNRGRFLLIGTSLLRWALWC